MGSTPIHITELGWPTSGTGSPIVTSEDARATYMAQATDTLARSDCGIADVIPYTWTTPESDPSDIEDWYGMYHWGSGAATPTGDAYTRVVQQWAARPASTATRVQVCHPPPAADLSTATSASAPTALTGGQLTYTITVANAGSAPARDASVLAAPPQGAALLSATPSTGVCMPGRLVNCALGTLAAGQTARVTLVVAADVPGTLASAATAASSTPDPNAANNASSATALVNAPPFAGVTLRTRRLSAKGGRAAFAVACPAGVYRGCAGTLRLDLPGSRKLGFSIAAGANRTVRVRLAKRSRAALGRRKRVLATLRSHDGAAQTRTGRWKLGVNR
jgi:uncharacterized repeat protein (TIGR01451 family)